jgi:hypothetical protein
VNLAEMNQWYMGERAQREIDRAIHETKAGS